MADSTDRRQIDRALAAKDATGVSGKLTGLKCIGLGIQFTLVGGFVPDLLFLVFVGTALCLLGLLIP
ncbi:MAG: hypothetical protein U9O06_03830 [Euryarchaeota archaeon]|nr:hypothetical protein [Euryarchaeota archaeon]